MVQPCSCSRRTQGELGRTLYSEPCTIVYGTNTDTVRYGTSNVAERIRRDFEFSFYCFFVRFRFSLLVESGGILNFPFIASLYVSDLPNVTKTTVLVPYEYEYYEKRAKSYKR